MGIPGGGVLHAIVKVHNRSASDPRPKDYVSLSLAGLDTISNKHVDWDRLDLVPGDTIEITVHEDGEIDPPTVKQPQPPEEYQDFPKRRVRSMAAKLGWTIIENPPIDGGDA